jgi:hypothetical protein
MARITLALALVGLLAACTTKATDMAAFAPSGAAAKAEVTATTDLADWRTTTLAPGLTF